MTDGRYVRKTTSTGQPLTLWHVAAVMRTTTAGRLTACGYMVSSPWPGTRASGWTHREWSDDLPDPDDRCRANGCRQRWSIR